MNTDWWNPPKPTTFVPINVFGPDDEPQTTAPKEMDFYDGEWANLELFICDCTWRWFWGKQEGWAWRMVWDGKAIGPLEAA